MGDLTSNPVPRPAYALGHSDSELERLTIQARLIDPITRQIFREAGIVPGMRVLDVGCGMGDVSFLVRELVGEAGEVIGVDRATQALESARARADARSLHNVSFREGDINEMRFEQPIDAVVGRYVLLFNPDPPAILRNLASHLRTGGVIAFHEPDWDGVRSYPPVPTYDQCIQWIVETFRLLGYETRMGFKLYSTFVAAGLPAPTMRLEAVIGGGANGAERLHLLADLTETLLPTMERLGVVTASGLSGQILAAQMQNEIDAGGGIVVYRSEVGAWSHVNPQ